jgi:hypothetical protein
MDSRVTDLRKEGSITFWIRRADNEQFSNPYSDIRFMLKKDVGGGVLITVLKERENLHVEIDNPEYGIVEFLHNISRYLDDDMMVALTWEKSVSKAYLNGELVAEGVSRRGEGMINIVYPREVQEMFEFMVVDTEHIRQTVNDRHRGFIIYGNPLRLGAIHWFDGEPIFVTGAITKTRQEGNNLKLDEVTVSLVLRLANKLPTGEISRDMDYSQILRVIAESFGLPVRCSKGQEPSHLHTDSDWDGEVHVEAPGQTFLLQGTFSPEHKKCSFVWAFSLDKYKKWFLLNFQSS